MSDLPRIGARELAALAEIAQWQTGGGLRRTRPYYWRPASMRKLQAHGLVELSPYGTDAAPAWHITDAGRSRAPQTKASP